MNLIDKLKAMGEGALELNSDFAKGIRSINERSKSTAANTFLYAAITGTPLLYYWITKDDFPTIVSLAWAGLTSHAWKSLSESPIEEGGIYGNARFSEQSEVRKSGMHDVPGIVFGKQQGKLVVKSSTKDGHALIMGGTGTGKSKSVAIPTILNWDGSIICIDVKGELYQTTAPSKRAQGYKVYQFNPINPIECDQYSPIANCGTVQGAKELAESLLPSPKKGDVFWSRSAQAIAAAALLEGHFRKQTFINILRRLCLTGMKELCQELLSSEYPQVQLLASQARDISEQVAQGVASELRSHITTMAADENLNAATTFSHWTPASLEEKSVIYLTIPEHLIEYYRPILNTILNQTITHLSQRKEGQTPPVLLLIDELPRLGYIPQLVPSLGTLRSRNVHLFNIIQSLPQLDNIYGTDARKIIIDNCDYKLILKATELETQKYLSGLLGQKTVKTKSISKDDGKERVTENETGVPLLRPEEWAELKKPILFRPNGKPVEVEKAWYNEKPVSNLIVQPTTPAPEPPVEEAQEEETQQAEVIEFKKKKRIR